MKGQWCKVKATAQNEHFFTKPDTVTFEFFITNDYSNIKMCREYAMNLLSTTVAVELVIEPLI